MQKVGQILTEKKHKYLMNIEVCQTGLSQSLKRPVISGGNLNLFGSDNVVTPVKVKVFDLVELLGNLQTCGNPQNLPPAK